MLCTKKVGKKQRSSNFELLRIVCMLLIICGHIIGGRGVCVMGTSSWYISQIFNSYCCIAVDIFVLISGYFGIKLNYRKLRSMNWMVTFYSIIFLALALAVGFHQFSPRTDWMQLVPVITKQYWFITVYFVLCLLSPYLNMLIEHLDKQTYQKLMLTMFAMFVILPTFSFVLNFKSITNDAGYGIVNFCFLYLLGRYIKLHYDKKIAPWKYLALGLTSLTALACFQILYSFVLGFYFNSLLSYDTIFIFVGAVSVFLFFKELSFTSKTINSLATTCLAVYVLHDNQLCYKYIFIDLLHFNKYEGLQYILVLITAPIAIYLICSIIETIRVRLFRLIKIS